MSAARRTIGATVMVLLSGVAPVQAARVLVLGSGSSSVDAAVIVRLEGAGHTVALGPQYFNFDGTTSLSNVDVVYFQANVNWSTGDMPAGGQVALVNFVTGGGGLVTSEWVCWKRGAQSQLQTLGSLFGVTISSAYDGAATVTYTAETADAALNAGLPASFTFPTDNYGGTQTFLVVAAGGTSFYGTVPGFAGVVGRAAGSGRVLHLSSTMGVASVNDANMGRLLSNAMHWASGGCAGDFDGNGQVQPADVSLFVSTWFGSITGGTLAGDFDGNGQVQPSDVSLFVSTWFASVVAGC